MILQAKRRPARQIRSGMGDYLLSISIISFTSFALEGVLIACETSHLSEASIIPPEDIMAANKEIRNTQFGKDTRRKGSNKKRKQRHLHYPQKVQILVIHEIAFP